MVGPMSEAQNGSESNKQSTSTPESLDTPIPALVPSTSVEGVNTNPSELIAIAPYTLIALPEPQRGDIAIAQGEALGEGPLLQLSPEGAAQSDDPTSPIQNSPPEDAIAKADAEYLAKLHAQNNPPPPFMPMHAALKKFKETYAVKLESLDPHDPEYQFILDRQAELNYHAAVERAELACDKAGFNLNKIPNLLKELNKAISTLQREKGRQAREKNNQQKEQLRREREERAAQRYQRKAGTRRAQTRAKDRTRKAKANNQIALTAI